MAEVMGADCIIDPAVEAPHNAWRLQAIIDREASIEEALSAAADALRPAVIFECVGVPGIIADIIARSPRDARIVVVGVCMEEDRFQPYQGIIKEIALQFVLGYTPEEFADTLHLINEGQANLAGLITGEVDLAGVAGAFQDLASPDKHAKIMVRP